MNVYQVRSDGEDRLYAAESAWDAITLDMEAFLDTDHAESTGEERARAVEAYRSELLEQVVLVGELENWPKGVAS